MYDFDTPTDRRYPDALKWKIAKDDELPMWVADMDFATAPQIVEAMHHRLMRDGFGYTDVTDAWYEAYQSWWQRRHGLSMKKEGLFYANGVIAALDSAIRAFTLPGEKILIQSPVYHMFYHIIENNGRFVVENELICQEGRYAMDLAALKKQLADPKVVMMILCNPHNPTGIIWEEKVLAEVADLAKANHVVVLSDEIHCDITEPGRSYVPFMRVSDTAREISVTAIAPTKCFNLAGIQTSAVYVENEQLRRRLMRQLANDDSAEPNVFSVAAPVAAFDEAEDWLDECNAYISENRKLVREYITEHLPELSVVEQEATYLLWIDVTALSDSSDTVVKKLRRSTGLILSAGKDFGTGGEHFVRMNIACPRALLRDGLKRLEKGIKGYHHAEL